MLDNPRDASGNPLIFPGAPAPDVAAHREATLAHLVRCAQVDATYARWAAGTTGQDNPDWHGDLLERFDAELMRLNIARPAPFVELASKLPPLTKGRRGLPKHRFFHETIA